ncbi:MAG TPA: hypothetical protein VGD08_21145 [Stellaceae bacterium]
MSEAGVAARRAQRARRADALPARLARRLAARGGIHYGRVVGLVTAAKAAATITEAEYKEWKALH